MLLPNAGLFSRFPHPAVGHLRRDVPTGEICASDLEYNRV